MIMNEALDRIIQVIQLLWDRGGLFCEFSRANLLAICVGCLTVKAGDFGQVCRRVIDTYKRKAYGKYLLWTGIMSAAGLVTSYLLPHWCHF